MKNALGMIFGIIGAVLTVISFFATKFAALTFVILLVLWLVGISGITGTMVIFIPIVMFFGGILGTFINGAITAISLSNIK